MAPPLFTLEDMNMNASTTRRLVLVIALLVCSAFTAARAQGSIVWSWSSFSGAEQGTFTTDGNLVAGAAPAATYTLSDFSVTASAALPDYVGKSAVGGEITIGNLVEGFIWDGSSATEFFRDSGVFTNGMNLYGNSPSGNYDKPRWVFDVNYLLLQDDLDLSPSNQGNLVLVPAEVVPEPASMALLGLGVLVMVRRNRWQW